MSAPVGGCTAQKLAARAGTRLPPTALHYLEVSVAGQRAARRGHPERAGDSARGAASCERAHCPIPRRGCRSKEATDTQGG
jgi:hypothetical protein